MYGQNQQPYGGQQPAGIACNCPKVVSALMTFFGFTLAGVGEFLLGSEYGKDADDIDRDDLTTYGILIAVGVLVGGIGYFVQNNVLCSRARGKAYFGNLLILVGLMSAVAFLFGGCLPLDNTPNSSRDSDVKSYNYLAGISYLMIFLGWVVAYYDAIPCRSGVFDPAALGHGFIVLFTLAAGIMFFVFAYNYDSSFTNEDDKDLMMGMRIAVGVSDIFIAIGLAMALGSCF